MPQNIVECLGEQAIRHQGLIPPRTGAALALAPCIVPASGDHKRLA